MFGCRGCDWARVRVFVVVWALVVSACSGVVASADSAAAREIRPDAPPLATAGVTPGWHGTLSNLDGSVIDLGPRSYNTTLTQFNQPDPIVGGSGTPNPHNYVNGDPIGHNDLSGTWTFRGLWNSFWGYLGCSCFQYAEKQLQNDQPRKGQRGTSQITRYKAKSFEAFAKMVDKLGGRELTAKDRNLDTVEELVRSPAYAGGHHRWFDYDSDTGKLTFTYEKYTDSTATKLVSRTVVRYDFNTKNLKESLIRMSENSIHLESISDSAFDIK